MPSILYRSVVSCVLSVAIIVTIAVALAQLPANAQQNPKKLTIFIEPDVHYDSVWMADAKGYYKDEGLDVDFKQFPTGMNALAAFRAGAGDIVVSVVLPV